MCTCSSVLTLFFSLPFHQAGKRNLFFTGHIALGLNGIVYQVYNPGLLKTDFLFSIMPLNEWLHGEGNGWNATHYRQSIGMSISMGKVKPGERSFTMRTR